MFVFNLLFLIIGCCVLSVFPMSSMFSFPITVNNKKNKQVHVHIILTLIQNGSLRTEKAPVRVHIDR